MYIQIQKNRKIRLEHSIEMWLNAIKACVYVCISSNKIDVQSVHSEAYVNVNVKKQQACMHMQHIRMTVKRERDNLNYIVCGILYIILSAAHFSFCILFFCFPPFRCCYNRSSSLVWVWCALFFAVRSLSSIHTIHKIQIFP